MIFSKNIVVLVGLLLMVAVSHNYVTAQGYSASMIPVLPSDQETMHLMAANVAIKSNRSDLVVDKSVPPKRINIPVNITVQKQRDATGNETNAMGNVTTLASVTLGQNNSTVYTTNSPRVETTTPASSASPAYNIGYIGTILATSLTIIALID